MLSSVRRPLDLAFDGFVFPSYAARAGLSVSIVTLGRSSIRRVRPATGICFAAEASLLLDSPKRANYLTATFSTRLKGVLTAVRRRRTEEIFFSHRG